jgi:hypothetical protein
MLLQSKHTILKSVILGFTLLATQLASAQFTEQKVIRKQTAFKSDATLRVNNRHGNITIRPWKKDSVSFQILIKGQSKSLEKLQLQIDRTTVNIHTSEFFAEATTVIDQSVFSKEWKKVKKIAGYKDEQVQINMVVHVPETANLELINEFGNIYMGNHQGNVEVDLKHGNFRAGNLQSVKRFQADFSNIFIRSASHCRMNLSFCELDVEQVNTLSITSRNSSRIESAKAKKIDLSSQNDHIKLGVVDQVRIIGKLSKLDIDRVNQRFYASLKYGKVHVKSFSCEMQNFTIKLQMGTADIGVVESCALSLTTIGESMNYNYGNLPHTVQPDGMYLKGTIGTSTDRTPLNITGNQSNINFYQN